MLDLSNIFNKDMKKAIMSKEKLAEMLRVTPEALKAFEKSYQLHSMNEPISDNLFKVNAKQAASLNPKQDVHEKGKVQDLIDRIVNELLDQALIYEYDGKPGFTYGNIYSCNQTRTVKVPENSEVTLEEINELPKELRPDLTGRYVKKSLSDGTGDALLEQYQQYLNTKDPRKKRFLYDHFRQGLDMLDLDGISYAILDRCQNSIGNWFPRLVNAIFYSDFFQLPKTKRSENIYYSSVFRQVVLHTMIFLEETSQVYMVQQQQMSGSLENSLRIKKTIHASTKDYHYIQNIVYLLMQIQKKC